jgi:hypothetical protein
MDPQWIILQHFGAPGHDVSPLADQKPYRGILRGYKIPYGAMISMVEATLRPCMDEK